MKSHLVKIALTAAALLLAVSISFAAEVKVTTPDVKGAAKATGDSAKASADSAKTGAKGAAADTKASATATKDAAKGAAADTKDAAKAKLVDINTASEAELKAIPGIGDAYAAKIIAGRPYAKKDQLKSRNILPAPVYEKTKDLIIAKQAVKEAVKAPVTKK
jgi:DNA uptake protein ComE-like DNA-binding protein